MNVLRDTEGIAHIVGLSGGKDSVCMALALREQEPRPYTYVCTPTGDELPEMVAHIDRLETLLGQPIIRLTNGTLASVIEDNNLDAEADEQRYGHTYRSAQRDSWPASLRDLRLLFEQGTIPEVSLRMMEKRTNMCRACSL